MKKLFVVTVISAMIFGAMSVQAEEIQLTKKETYIKQIIASNYNYTPAGLFAAIGDGNLNCIDLFMKSGMDPNTSIAKIPAVYYAITKKQPQIVNRFLQAGVDPNMTIKGRTLLNAAIASNNPETVNLLVKAGANVNQESWGITPLSYAVKKKNADMVHILVNAGAKVNEDSLGRALKSKSEIKDCVLAKYKKQG